MIAIRNPKAAALLAFAALLAAPQQAVAERIVVLAHESADGVQLDWSGSLNLDKLDTQSRSQERSFVNAKRGKLMSLDGDLVSAKWKTKADPFGDAGRIKSSLSYGDEFGMNRGRVFVDEDYSGETLDGGMVLDGASFADMGLEEGRSVYRLGNRQRVVLKVVGSTPKQDWVGSFSLDDGKDAAVSAVPIPATLPLLAGGAGLFAALGLRRRRRSA